MANRMVNLVERTYVFTWRRKNRNEFLKNNQKPLIMFAWTPDLTMSMILPLHEIHQEEKTRWNYMEINEEKAHTQ